MGINQLMLMALLNQAPQIRCTNLGRDVYRSQLKPKMVVDHQN